MSENICKHCLHSYGDKYLCSKSINGGHVCKHDPYLKDLFKVGGEIGEENKQLIDKNTYLQNVIDKMKTQQEQMESERILLIAKLVDQ